MLLSLLDLTAIRLSIVDALHILYQGLKELDDHLFLDLEIPPFPIPLEIDELPKLAPQLGQNGIAFFVLDEP